MALFKVGLVYDAACKYLSGSYLMPIKSVGPSVCQFVNMSICWSMITRISVLIYSHHFAVMVKGMSSLDWVLSPALPFRYNSDNQRQRQRRRQRQIHKERAKQESREHAAGKTGGMKHTCRSGSLYNEQIN